MHLALVDHSCIRPQLSHEETYLQLVISEEQETLYFSSSFLLSNEFGSSHSKALGGWSFILRISLLVSQCRAGGVSSVALVSLVIVTAFSPWAWILSWLEFFSGKYTSPLFFSSTSFRFSRHGRLQSVSLTVYVLKPGSTLKLCDSGLHGLHFSPFLCGGKHLFYYHIYVYVCIGCI